MQKQKFQQLHIKKQYYIKGSGTSYCLINNSSCDEQQFIPFKFRQYLSQQNKHANIKDISMAGLYLIILLQNGQTYKLGSFMNHQNIFKTPILVFNSKQVIKQISSGWDHTIFKTSNNQFYGLGSNKYLQLSIKQGKKYYIKPQKIHIQPYLPHKKIRKFICGFRQSYFITQDKELYGCGQSKKYQLGIKSCKLNQMIKICQLNNKMEVDKIQNSKRALFILLNDGSLYAIGANEYEIFNHQNQMHQINKCHQYYQSLTQINTHVKDFSCGWTHIILLKQNSNSKDKLYIQSYGRNNFGQLGRIKQTNKQCIIKLNNIQQINSSSIYMESGSQFNFCCNKGKLYGWGWNQHENIVNNKQEVILQPQQVKYPKSQICMCKRVWTYAAITIVEIEQKNKKQND